MGYNKRVLELSGIDYVVNQSKIDEVFNQKSMIDKVKEKLGVKKKSKAEKMKDALRRLSPGNIEKTIKRYNKNLKRTTLSDSFSEAVAKSAVYAFRVTKKTIRELDRDDIEHFSKFFSLKMKITDERFKGGTPPKEIIDKIMKKIENLSSKFERTIEIEYGDGTKKTLSYDEWINS